MLTKESASKEFYKGYLSSKIRDWHFHAPRYFSDGRARTAQGDPIFHKLTLPTMPSPPKGLNVLKEGELYFYLEATRNEYGRDLHFMDFAIKVDNYIECPNSIDRVFYKMTMENGKRFYIYTKGSVFLTGTNSIEDCASFRELLFRDKVIAFSRGSKHSEKDEPMGVTPVLKVSQCGVLEEIGKLSEVFEPGFPDSEENIALAEEQKFITCPNYGTRNSGVSAPFLPMYAAVGVVVLNLDLEKKEALCSVIAPKWLSGPHDKYYPFP